MIMLFFGLNKTNGVTGLFLFKVAICDLESSVTSSLVS